MHQLAMRHAAYGIHTTTRLPYERAVAAVTTALQEEGFGVLTEIDMKATLKKKLDADVSRYVILGACNPPLAQKALTAEPDIGLLLPCNVVVAERADGACEVSALRPSLLFERLVESEDIADVAQDAEERLVRALDKVASMA